MVLGDLLARSGDESAAVETVLGLGDLNLLAALRQRAEEEGLELAAFSALAVRHYVEGASDEEWITLMGVPGRSADPGLAFIKRALTLATDAVA